MKQKATLIISAFIILFNTAKAQDNQQPVCHLMRSIIMVNVKDYSYLPEAYWWLYKYHVPESMSQFSPYVTKYSTYRALPLPKGAEKFGSYNWIMTEHYWLINPFNTSKDNTPSGIAFKESYSKRYMEITCQPTDDGLRPEKWMGSQTGYHPTVFAFIPSFWENDFKGSNYTTEDGPVFRWLVAFKYPDNVSQTEGDKWFSEVMAPEIARCPDVLRVLSSKVLKEPKTGPFQRVMEVWFKDSHKWEETMDKLETAVQKPDWSEYKLFPYMEPYKDFVGIFLMETPESNHLEQYKGWQTTR